MRNDGRAWRDVLRKMWREEPNARRAAMFLLEYVALKTWVLVIGCFPIHANLRTARLLGRLYWRLSKRHRERALANLRPALGDRYDEQTLRRIGRESVEHLAQLYMVEMPLTPRLVNEWSWSRYVELGNLRDALRELLCGRGALLLTPHFGNYELLGFTLVKLGLPTTAIMRPLDNPLITQYIVSTRAASGLDLLFKKGAMERADELVTGGVPLSFIADQDAGRKGVFVDFFGRKASWYKSIALLAMRYEVPIVVGTAARVRSQAFRYRIAVERIILPAQWQDQDDPLTWITQQYAASMEAAIRRHPEQYLWMHRRWKTRPKNEAASA